MDKKIEWFGKENPGIEVVKVAGKAVVITLAVVALGVGLGAVNNAFGE